MSLKSNLTKTEEVVKTFIYGVWFTTGQKSGNGLECVDDKSDTLFDRSSTGK